MLKLGRFLNVDVSLHWTLFLLIGWTAVTSPGGVVPAILFMTAVFSCVLAHEFGHSLAARQYGIETASINLFPIGGVATLTRMPREPKQELWIAAAGPLVNVAIAGLLFLLRDSAALIFGPHVHTWLTHLLVVNLLLVGFNLLPAFPMDGGRMLRAVAAMFLPYVQATHLAASVGKVMAIGLGLVGMLNGHFMLMLIAAFIVYAGSTEANFVAEESRQDTRWNVHPRLVRTMRNGRTVFAIWDDGLQAYRVLPATSIL